MPMQVFSLPSILTHILNSMQFTLEALILMASGDPVDVQRETRWPNRTGARGVKVAFKPYEEDSDYSDEEGVLLIDGSYDM